MPIINLGDLSYPGVVPLVLVAGANVTLTVVGATLVVASSGGGGGSALPGVCNFVLTLETGVPYSTTNQVGRSTVYATPINGDHVSIYNGAAWVDFTSAEMSLALSGLATGSNYDVFVYSNAGVPTLLLGPAWTSNTARGAGAGTTELTTQDGVSVNAQALAGGPAALQGVYLGTIRTTAATTTESSASKRFVYNHFNQLGRALVAVDATSNWTYTTATVRQANGNAANQVEYVTGDPATLVAAALVQSVYMVATSSAGFGGIGLDSTTVIAGTFSDFFNSNSGLIVTNTAHYLGTPGLGYHVLTWLECGPGVAGAMSWNGTNAATAQCGLSAQIVM